MHLTRKCTAPLNRAQRWHEVHSFHNAPTWHYQPQINFLKRPLLDGSSQCEGGPPMQTLSRCSVKCRQKGCKGTGQKKSERMMFNLIFPTSNKHVLTHVMCTSWLCMSCALYLIFVRLLNIRVDPRRFGLFSMKKSRSLILHSIIFF